MFSSFKLPKVLLITLSVSILSSEVFNDDALSAHESELDRMRGFYIDNSAVFKLVSKREKLWKQWLDFESKSGDPSRLFNDRGGKLQKELKQRNTVSKELPKVASSSGTLPGHSVRL